MSPSPKIADEIARLMRDPDSMRAETEQMRRATGRGHYNPNQPRVAAGNPKGGQFASKGHRGGARRDQRGSGNPGAAYAQALPFDGELGFMSPAQHRAAQTSFVQEDNNPKRDRRNNFQSDRGRYRFLSMGPFGREHIPGGARWVISSTTYVHDRDTGAYATISATPARPIVITSSYDKLFIRPFNLQSR